VNIDLGLGTKIAVTLLFLFILDILLAFFVLGNTSWAYKSKAVILSNLLFLEGIAIFALCLVIFSGHYRSRAYLIARRQSLGASSKDYTENSRRDHKKVWSTITFLLIVGTTLIGLAIAIGFLS